MDTINNSGRAGLNIMGKVIFDLRIHARASSGVSKNQRSSHFKPRASASARILDISSRLGVSSPASHLETVPCETSATAASSVCDRESTSLRMKRNGLMSPRIFENEFIRQGILFEDASRYRLPCPQIRIGHMKAREAVPRILEVTGWTQKDLARKIGVSQGTVSKWMNEGQSPNTRQWDAVLDLIRHDSRLSDLAQELEPAASADMVGQVGAGSKIDDFFDDDAGTTQVVLPFPAFGDFISFEILGDSMLPKYEPGEVVVVWKDQRRNTESFIGELCVVRLETGERYLKKLAAGSQPGLYRLESFNASPITDVSVAWVGEIMATVPAKQVKTIVVPPVKKKARSGR